MVFRRLGNGPFITRDDVPDIPKDAWNAFLIDVTSVFNPGAFSHGSSDYLLLRVQTRGRHTYFVPARVDGDEVTVPSARTVFSGISELMAPETGYDISHVYDPRITIIGHTMYVVTAMDTDKGCRLAIWQGGGLGLAGLDELRLESVLHDVDSRNGVLFPEKIGGRFAMLHRPNIEQRTGAPASGSTIVLSLSDDLENWDAGRPVMSGRPARWDELIGSGPPPIKTTEGWLHLYHGIATHFQSVNIYQAGVVLLDLDDPSRVVSRCTDNVLEPREMWEMVGQVPNVVFPSGWTISKTGADGFAPMDAVVRIYYGAADTCVGCAETTVEELILAARR